MDFFKQIDLSSKTADDFIEYVCSKYGNGKESFHDEFMSDLFSNGRTTLDAIDEIFHFDCFSADESVGKRKKVEFITKLFEFMISGKLGIDNLARKCTYHLFVYNVF